MSKNKNIPFMLADIGATNARFALFDAGGISRVQILETSRFQSPDEAAKAYLEQFCADLSPPRQAAFCIAGTVAPDQDDAAEISMANTGWRFTRGEIKKTLGLDRLVMLNDFAALAYALPWLGEDDLLRLGGVAQHPEAPKIVLGPGSGLGMAALVPVDEGSWRVLAGEGGHQTLPVETAREADVLAFMREEQEHICIESVISGPGLFYLFQCLCRMENMDQAGLVRPEDVIASGMGQRTEAHPAAVEALDMFCALLGGVAGDAALAFGARGGVYLAGGVAQALADFLPESRFNQRFCRKGGLSHWLEPIPRCLIRHEFPAFIGLKAVL